MDFDKKYMLAVDPLKQEPICDIVDQKVEYMQPKHEETINLWEWESNGDGEDIQEQESIIIKQEESIDIMDDHEVAGELQSNRQEQRLLKQRNKRMDDKINRSEIIKLINLYRDNECLWNINKSIYKRPDLKIEAYQDMAKQLNMNVDFIKKKIKHLRTVYSAEKKKMLQERKCSNSTDDLYAPTLFYFNDMTFLDETITVRKSTTNIDQKTMHDSKSNTSSETWPEFTDGHNTKFDGTQVMSNNVEFGTVGYCGNTLTNNKFKKKRKSSATEPTKFDNALNRLIKVAVPQEENMFTLFGKTIGIQLTKLPELVAFQAMAQIQQYLTECMIKSVKTKTETTATSQYNKYTKQSTLTSSQTSIGSPQSSTDASDCSTTQPNTDVSAVSSPIHLNLGNYVQYETQSSDLNKDISSSRLQRHYIKISPDPGDNHNCPQIKKITKPKLKITRTATPNPNQFTSRTSVSSTPQSENKIKQKVVNVYDDNSQCKMDKSSFNKRKII